MPPRRVLEMNLESREGGGQREAPQSSSGARARLLETCDNTSASFQRTRSVCGPQARSPAGVPSTLEERFFSGGLRFQLRFQEVA